MSERTPGDGRRGDGPDDAGAGAAAPGAPGAPEERRRRRIPSWMLLVGGVLVIAAVATVVLLLSNRTPPPVDQPVPEAEVVTLPPPSPTIDPVEREEGTAFYQSLPSTVLSYALVESGDHPPLLAEGALEAYRLVYSDGAGTEVVVLAGQWEDAAQATAVLEARRAAADAAAPAEPTETTEPEPGAEESPGDEPAEEPEQVERQEGGVEVDGTEVGQYLIVPGADGSGTAWWTNQTVVVQVDGPAAVLDEFFAAFPL